MRTVVSAQGRFLVSRALAAVLVACACGGGVRAQEDYFKEASALLGEAAVESVSKYAQDPREVAATLTVVGRDEIERYGLRTLADVINYTSLGGYTLYDHMYDWVGMRGMFGFLDFNTRVVLMLNGHILNEPYNNFAGFGREMTVPMDLVERVEILYGPWGVLYGTSNLYGIVNVVTRKPEDLQGIAARAGGGSYGALEGLASWGLSGSLGGQQARFLLSAGQYETDGPKDGYPRVDLVPSDAWYGPVTWAGTTLWGGPQPRGTDRERSPYAFLDASLGDFRLQGRWGYRMKGLPLAAYGSVYGDTRAYLKDTRSFAELAWSKALAPRHSLSANVSYDYYQYCEREPYYDPSLFPGEPGYFWILRTNTYRTSAEFKYTWKPAEGALVLGASYRRERLAQLIQSEDLERSMPPADASMETVSQRVWAAYALGEWAPRPELRGSVGLNYVKYNYTSGLFLYRVALVWLPNEDLAFKAIAGRGFRAPSWYEYGYQDAYSNLRNPALASEVSPAGEVSLTWKLSGSLQATGAAFLQKNEGFIKEQTIQSPADIRGNVLPPGADHWDYVGFVQYQNVGDVTTYGVSVALNGSLPSQIRWHTALSWQRASSKEGGVTSRLQGSPLLIANGGFSGVAGPFAWGLAAYYHGAMLTSDGHRDLSHEVGGYLDVRLRLAWEKLFGQPLKLELIVGNALGARQAEPIASVYVPETAPRSSRWATLSLVYRF
jgi:iron complex outermembrane receptor protein